jgi:drug/metabolite transporter (DMT)-like permease
MVSERRQKDQRNSCAERSVNRWRPTVRLTAYAWIGRILGSLHSTAGGSQSMSVGVVARENRIDALGIAGVVLCCALWGGNAVAVKAAVPDIPSFGCAGLRFLISLPLVALVCWRAGQPLWVSRSRLGLLLVHALFTVVQIGTFNWGTSHSLAGRSSVLINIHPLVVAPLAWVVFGERLGSRGWLGLAAAALGVTALVSEKLKPGGDVRGDLVVIASGIIFGIQTIVQKATFSKIPPATMLFGQSVLAIPIFFACSGLVEGFENYHFTNRAIWGVLYQGTAVSGFCFSTWMLLLRRYPAGKLATVAFITPFFGVTFGNLAQGDPLTWPLLAGGTLVGVGIYLVASDRTAHGLPPDIALPGEDAP